jgi:hypothetical protein
MLAIGPNPDLGLSRAPTSDHSYATLDELCQVIDECEAIEALDVAALRVALDRGEQDLTPHTRRLTPVFPSRLTQIKKLAQIENLFLTPTYHLL